MNEAWQDGYNAGIEHERAQRKKILDEVFNIITRESFFLYPKWEAAIDEATEKVESEKNEE